VFLAVVALPLAKTSAMWQQLLLNAVPKYTYKEDFTIRLLTNNKILTKVIKANK